MLTREHLFGICTRERCSTARASRLVARPLIHLRGSMGSNVHGEAVRRRNDAVASNSGWRRVVEAAATHARTGNTPLAASLHQEGLYKTASRPSTQCPFVCMKQTAAENSKALAPRSFIT